jgi:hypothetical protein
MRPAVFLSGPVTGVSHESAREAFEGAQKKIEELSEMSCWVFNPLRHVPSNWDHAAAMRLCISELTAHLAGAEAYYNALIQLSGWQESEGARTELEVALACGIPVFSLTGFLFLLQDAGEKEGRS